MSSPRFDPAAVILTRFRRIGLVAFLVLLLIPRTGASTRGATQESRSRSPGPTRLLERIWPGYPIWLAMLAEILSGQTLAPDRGWFRKAVSQTHFDWRNLADRLDGNHDGAIDRDEFRGREADFLRLDRDRDGVLTEADLDFSSDLDGGFSDFEAFSTADRDGDSKLSRPEFLAFARETEADPIYRLIFANPRQELEARLVACEREGSAFLTLSDFQEAFALSARRPRSPLRSFRPAPTPKVDTSALLRAFLRQEIGGFGAGPALAALAPDFTLKTADGRQEIHLAKLIGPRPVVLIFGNFTCGPFRGHSGSLERLFERYKDRVDFVVVYTREAHPADGWQLDDNRARGIAVNQPRDLVERSVRAQTCGRTLRLGMPVLVDTMNDRVGSLYSGMPSRAYVIDHLGKITYKGGRGPFGFKPASLEQSLILLLHSDPAAYPAPDPTSNGLFDVDNPTSSRDIHLKAWAGLGLVAVLVALGIAWSRRSATSSKFAPPEE